MNREQADLMLKHAAFLRDHVDPKDFHMGTYSKGPIDDEHPCGTTACAVGYMPLVWPEWFVMKPALQTENIVRWRDGRIFDEDEFYGLSDADWSLLFSGTNVRTPQEQAQVMIDFVENYDFNAVRDDTDDMDLG